MLKNRSILPKSTLPLLILAPFYTLAQGDSFFPDSKDLRQQTALITSHLIKMDSQNVTKKISFDKLQTSSAKSEQLLASDSSSPLSREIPLYVPQNGQGFYKIESTSTSNRTRKSKKIDLKFLAASPFPLPLGIIIQSPVDSITLTLGDWIWISKGAPTNESTSKPEEIDSSELDSEDLTDDTDVNENHNRGSQSTSSSELKVGSFYTVVHAPQEVEVQKVVSKSGDSEAEPDLAPTEPENESTWRSTSSPILGQIVIREEHPNYFLAQIVRANAPIRRGDWLIPQIKSISDLQLVPGPTSLHAQVLPLEASLESSMTASQFQWVALNKGSNAGIKKGMVFRIYEPSDPVLQTRLSHIKQASIGEVLVLHVSKNSATGLVFRSKKPIKTDQLAVLMTDLSDLYNKKGSLTQTGEPAQQPEETNEEPVDELDLLDNGQEASSDEQQELNQLEAHPDSSDPNSANDNEGINSESDESNSTLEPSSDSPTPSTEQELESPELEEPSGSPDNPKTLNESDADLEPLD